MGMQGKGASGTTAGRRAFWFSSAQVAREALRPEQRMQVDAAIDNASLLIEMNPPDIVQRLLNCDDSGGFLLPVGSLMIRCHADLFGTRSITVKRIEFDHVPGVHDAPKH